MEEYFLGIDVGSVSTNLVISDGEDKIVSKLYLRTGGTPIAALTNGMKKLQEEFGAIRISGVGTTGSGRQLAGVIVGADLVKKRDYRPFDRITESNAGRAHDFGNRRTGFKNYIFKKRRRRRFCDELPSALREQVRFSTGRRPGLAFRLKDSVNMR